MSGRNDKILCLNLRVYWGKIVMNGERIERLTDVLTVAKGRQNLANYFKMFNFHIKR